MKWPLVYGRFASAKLLSLCWAFYLTGIVVTEACIVTAPSLFRLGVKETILVRNRDNAEKNVTVRATDYPAHAHLLFSHSFVLKPDAGEIVEVKLDQTKFSTEDLSSNFSKYVSLGIECGDKLKKEVVVLLDTRSGYIFLQTDKPIYNPRQTVHLRVVAVDEELVPSTSNIRLEIKNPQGIVSYAAVLGPQSQFGRGGMYSDNYRFSSYPIYGQWKAVATYGEHNAQRAEVSFRLEEYVLPTFGVRLAVPQAAILPSAPHIFAVVDASYVYGKRVEGTVLITVSVRNEANHDVKLGSKLVKKLIDGRADFNVSALELRNGSRWQEWVQGNRLVVRAVVVEEATAKQEAAEDDSALFSHSPYILSLEHTRRDFKPGSRVAVVAQVRYTNKKPASKVNARIVVTTDDSRDVDSLARTVTTNEEGKAFFSFTPFERHRVLKITVRTDDEHFREDEQTEAEATMMSFNSTGDAFVSIQPENERKYSEGDNMDLILTVRPIQLSPIYYQVTSRGRIVKHGVLTDTLGPHRSVHIQASADMAPKFRLLVFAFHEGHIVADSEDFEMKEACPSAANIAVTAEFSSHQPGDTGTISISGRRNTTVGLLVVDKAVHLLSDADLLTSKKIFKAIRSHDLSCGPGGGVTTTEVLANAGLIVISEETSNDIVTTENSCAARAHRRRRHVRDAGSKYEEDQFLRLCCYVGTLPDRLGRHCSTREEIIRRHFRSARGDRCADAFAECCGHAFGAPMEWLDVSRARDGIPEFHVPDISSVLRRRDFQETWMFQQDTLGEDGLFRIAASLPHSVTTWLVQTVAVSPDGGVCVAEPLEIVAFRNVFLQVSVPATVVRNEQVQILATLFNYGSDNLRATLSFRGAPELCIASRHPSLPHKKELTVKGNSAASVSFPVVPLKRGRYNVSVHAAAGGGQDLVEKFLTVVPEGIQVEKSFSIPLDPSNEQRRKRRSVGNEMYTDVLGQGAARQIITIKTGLPPDAVPDTKSCSISVVGNEMRATGEASISSVDKLISMPRGCGEQNMMIMAPVLYALKYLKLKGMLNVTDRQTALSYLRKGYDQELAYRNADGSFSTFKDKPGSLWLTAFVLRVFCEAKAVIDVSDDVILSGLSWLARKQGANGSFEDPNPILHRNMLGSVRGTTAMTAFVLLTLHECASSSIPRTEAAEVMRRRAQFYITQRLDSIKFPYVAALTAYALSFQPDDGKKRSMAVLRSNVLEDTELNLMSTGNEATGMDVEGTSYALLAHLKHGDIESSKKFVNWLLRHRSASGSFVSTQDTIVALQALSEYAVEASNRAPDINAEVFVDNEPASRTTFRIKRDNSAILQELDIHNAKQRIIVNASGVGAASLNVKLRYHVLVPPEKEKACKFSLSATADVYKEAAKAGALILDAELLKKLEVNADPFAQLITRRRVGRSKAKKILGGKNTQAFKVQVCTSYLGSEASNMVIMDIGMFTGFSPIEDDLKKVVAENPAVGRFETKDKSVIFYLDSVTAAAETCVAFRIQQDFKITNAQTASVRVYDYYKPDESCSKFYGLNSSTSSVQLFCEGNQCKCAAAECPVNATFLSELNGTKNQNKYRIQDIACEDHDFVWKGTVIANHVLAGYRQIYFNINNVIKQGEENATTLLGNVRRFQSRALCDASDLAVGQEYFIFGQDSEEYSAGGDTTVRYPLNHKVRIHQPMRGKQWKKVSAATTWLSEKFKKEGSCG
ncbi:venom factor-like isoform X1 [Haemaphysalis longicornis]